MSERMTRQEVVALMQSSRDEKEWNDNCDAVKKQGGYPGFWFEAIMLSGLADKVRKSWMSTAVRGNLTELMPEVQGSIKVMELLPPDEQEIAEIRKQLAERANNG